MTALPLDPPELRAIYLAAGGDTTLGLERGRDIATRQLAGRLTRYAWAGDQVVSSAIEFEGPWPEAWARFRALCLEADPCPT